MADPTRRFSNRVEDYVKYRPGYPPEAIEVLRRECGLSPSSVVADIGSGTGFLSRVFLEIGNHVFGVEPNKEMREAGEKHLSGYPSFTSVPATAEETSLPDSRVDFVVAGQAFHWFDPEKTRREFERVLEPGGWVALVWNSRRASTPFLAEYDRMVEVFGTDYASVNYRDRTGDEEVRAFFAPDEMNAATFENRQAFDLEGLRGRMLSSSYMPVEGEPGFPEMLEEMERVFHKFEKNGEVELLYETRMYYGRFSRD